ncbi:hypothetical protein OOU_Y34scaffold00766g30 [Pyricularia oryzae Y34]|uniref:Uncharacterized protein n=1 Tax=Pyricularia oryzae (strain Y34) TaxID=1143189 RepID=A0AA97NQH0_PYRO3|nr:hypothetical protein OOU_Y34scaffold00766g30 [Pyricularia oryzae Y34]
MGFDDWELFPKGAKAVVQSIQESGRNPAGRGWTISAEIEFVFSIVRALCIRSKLEAGIALEVAYQMRYGTPVLRPVKSRIQGPVRKEIRKHESLELYYRTQHINCCCSP